MFKKYKNNVYLYHFDNLSKFDEIAHFVTTRKGGVSDPPFDSMNIGLTSGDNPIKVMENRELLSVALEFPSQSMVFSKQVHDKTVRVMSLDELERDKAARGVPKVAADSMITDLPNICISVAIADCVPIILYDPTNKAAGIVHSGWKGTTLKIAKYAVEAMASNYNSDPTDIIAGIGPSISQTNYEVGENVITAVKKSFGVQSDKLLDIKDNGKAMLNLWEANRLILQEAGLVDKNIELAGECTYSGVDLYYSFRRDGAQFGRLAAGIMIRTF